MTRSTRNWIVISISLFASVLIISASLLYRETSKLRDNSFWVAHTHETIAKIERVLARVRDAETGQRGFLLTGQPNYLLPYNDAMTYYDAEFKELRTLVEDNVEQQARLDQLSALVQSKFDELKTTIALRKEDNLAAAVQLVETDQGRQIMRKILGIVDQMQNKERELLAARSRANDETYQSALRNIIFAAVIGMVALGSLGFLLHVYVRNIERSADEIFRQQELLKATLVSIGDAVIATDANGHVTFMNAVAEELTGWRQQEAAGVPLDVVFNIVNETTREKVENPALRALHEGKIVGLANHTILIAKSGKEWPIDDSAAPIRTAAGFVEGAILCFREISERKSQEDELRRQSEALVHGDRRKDEFLAMLAHELRNPLSPLSNSLQLWPFVKDDPAEMERIRTLMDRQVHQMTRLIDDLMDVSRITRGKIQLRKSRIDITTPIVAALESVKPFAESQNHEVITKFCEEPLHVIGDVARLTQVFGNIINNAIKYTGRDGKITISADEENGHAVVRVRDNGPGIPSHMLEEIFEMFRQVDGTLERSHGGMGIGLTLAKRLVLQHGGTIEAKSAGTNQGSEFIITLPLSSVERRKEDRGHGDGANSTASRLPSFRILVVDDVMASAHTLALMLKTFGQQVTEKHDGLAAIEWTLANRPDVVFLDISMPGMSGYEVANHLRSEISDIILVALTGYGQEEDRRKAFDAGFNYHLVKPTSMESLETLLVSLPVRHQETDRSALPRDVLPG